MPKPVTNIVSLIIHCQEHGILLYDILCSDMFKAIAWTDKEQEVIADVKRILAQCVEPEDRE